jgi:hypothetical protein
MTKKYKKVARNKYLQAFLKSKNLKIGKDGNFYTQTGKLYEGDK